MFPSNATKQISHKFVGLVKSLKDLGYMWKYKYVNIYKYDCWLNFKVLFQVLVTWWVLH